MGCCFVEIHYICLNYIGWHLPMCFPCRPLCTTLTLNNPAVNLSSPWPVNDGEKTIRLTSEKKTNNYTTVDSDPKHFLNTNSVVAEHAQTHGMALTA